MVANSNLNTSTCSVCRFLCMTYPSEISSPLTPRSRSLHPVRCCLWRLSSPVSPQLVPADAAPHYHTLAVACSDLEHLFGPPVLHPGGPHLGTYCRPSEGDLWMEHSQFGSKMAEVGSAGLLLTTVHYICIITPICLLCIDRQTAGFCNWDALPGVHGAIVCTCEHSQPPCWY